MSSALHTDHADEIWMAYRLFLAVAGKLLASLPFQSPPKPPTPRPCQALHLTICTSTDSSPVLNTWGAEVAEGVGVLLVTGSPVRRQVHKQLPIAAK